jgi:hypothetical protein
MTRGAPQGRRPGPTQPPVSRTDRRPRGGGFDAPAQGIMRAARARRARRHDRRAGAGGARPCGRGSSSRRGARPGGRGRAVRGGRRHAADPAALGDRSRPTRCAPRASTPTLDLPVGRGWSDHPAVFLPFRTDDPPPHPHAPTAQAALHWDAGADPAGDVEVLLFTRPFVPTATCTSCARSSSPTAAACSTSTASPTATCAPSTTAAPAPRPAHGRRPPARGAWVRAPTPAATCSATTAPSTPGSPPTSPPPSTCAAARRWAAWWTPSCGCSASTACASPTPRCSPSVPRRGPPPPPSRSARRRAALAGSRS